MSFSLDASKIQPNTTSSGDAPATGALPSFSFGGTGAGDAGKGVSSGFGTMSTPVQNKPGGLFGTGLSSTPVQGTGFSFGTPSTTPGITGGTLGTPASTQGTGLTFGAAATPTSGITFGSSGTTPSTGFAVPTATGGTSGFTLGSSTATTTAPLTGLTFGTAKRATNTGFSLGGGEATAPASGSLTFGTPNTMTTGTGFSLGSALTATTTSTTTTAATGFGLGSGATPATAAGLSLDKSKTSTGQTGFSLAPTTATPQSDSGFGATTTATTAAATGFSLGGTATTSAATGFIFSTGTTATTSTGFSLNKTSGTASLSLAAPTTQLSLGTTTTVSSSTNGSQPVAINFFQLEESINKWTLELEEQEKVFVNQASQINAWDKLLITNGEKIVTLNQEVERVKIEQQQLEHELDYVVGQQKELQDCLAPLEKELASLSVSDTEREYTYRLAENLDTQLKQMSEDLKEIIEHLNEANRTQDSSDPIVQIGKILNAHMNSLQWLDQQTTLLSQKIQQIDQMHQNFRHENERSFSLAYN